MTTTNSPTLPDDGAAPPATDAPPVLCLLLDRSGSMASIQSDMEGGFDTFIAAQRALGGECRVTLNQFDTEYECVYRGRPVADVPPLQLVPRGATALHDALGRTIVDLQEELGALPDEEQPEKVIVVVLTDGLENSSVEWTPNMLRALVTAKQPAWEFVFIGAEQDALLEGEAIGIGRHASLSTRRTGSSARAQFSVLSEAVVRVQSTRAPLTFTDDERAEALGDDTDD